MFLEALRDYASDAASGRGRFVVVEGEPGIGKTSLVDAFRDSRPTSAGSGAPATAASPRSLWARCTRWPTRSAARLLAAMQGRRSPPAVRGVHAELRISRVRPGSWSRTCTGPTRPRSTGWAYVARRVDRTNALVIVTVRDQEAGPDTRLDRRWPGWSPIGRRGRMTLPALSPDAVRQPRRRLVPRPGPGLRADRRATRYLVRKPWQPVRRGPPLGGRRRDGSRGGLSPETQRLLKAAAVLARPATVDVLESVSGCSGALVDECVASGTLLVEGTLFRFRHELTRRAVEDAIPAFRRAELHRLALDVMEAREATSRGSLTTRQPQVTLTGPCATARRRETTPPPWPRTERQPLSIDGRSSTSAPPDPLSALRCTRSCRPRCRCRTTGSSRSSTATPLSRCAESWASQPGSARTSGTGAPACGGCAAEKRRTPQSGRPTG